MVATSGRLLRRTDTDAGSVAQDVAAIRRIERGEASLDRAQDSDAEAAQLVEMGGEDDHVHLLVQYPPKVAVSNLVISLKGVSSRLLRKERPDVEKRYWKGVLWSPPYFASSCGGAPISIVRQYIEQQQTPH